MIKKIIFFVESPWEQRDEERFGVALLEENGFEVEVYDFTPTLYPRVVAEYTSAKPIVSNRVHLFSSKEKILAAIAGMDPSHTFVFYGLGVTPEKLFIYRALSDCLIKYGFLTPAAIPIASRNTDLLQKLIHRLREPIPCGIFLKKVSCVLKRRLMDFYLRWYIRLKSRSFNFAEIWVLGGKESAKTFSYPKGRNTKFVLGHAFDYDSFLRVKELPVAVTETAVFLDQYLPFHPDNIYDDSAPPPVQAEEYYPLLVNSFRIIEEALAVKVVIAAHPRSEYGAHPDYFEGRSVIRGKTLEMVREAKVVIAHDSLSLNFAVMCSKPVIFLTMDVASKSWWGPQIDCMSSCLGKIPINMNRPMNNVDWNAELMVNEDCYRAYLESYIKSPGSPELPLWQIVADRLKEIN